MSQGEAWVQAGRILQGAMSEYVTLMSSNVMDIPFLKQAGSATSVPQAGTSLCGRGGRSKDAAVETL
jgi:hypothetical protein